MTYINHRLYDNQKIYKRDPETWGPSLTKPNMAMPLQELAARVRDGRPVPDIQLPIQPPPEGGEPQFSDADYQEGMRTNPLLTIDAMREEHTRLALNIEARKKTAQGAENTTTGTVDRPSKTTKAKEEKEDQAQKPADKPKDD